MAHGTRRLCTPGQLGDIALSPHTRRTCDDIDAFVDVSSLKVTTPDWAFTVSAQPVYDHISGPRHRLLDIKVGLLANETMLRPHGIVGQSFDGDDRPRRGKLDRYPPRSLPGRFRTTAMAEGAIDGVAADYVLAHPRATDFAYSRFAQRPSGDVPKALLTHIARVTDEDEDEVATDVGRRLSESMCPCPSPPAAPPGV